MKLIILAAVLSSVMLEHVLGEPGTKSLAHGITTLEHAYVSGIEDRIVSGEAAESGQFPHQVGIHIFNIYGQRSFCGGSVISKEWVLTAAHCVNDADSMILRFGTLNTFRTRDEDNVQRRESSNYIMHENYNSRTLNNDVAVIKLDSPLDFNDKVQSITLSSDEIDEGVEVIVSGYGATTTGGRVSDVLRFVDLTTISNEKCQETFGSRVIIDSTLCANGENSKAHCQGDSGGPLVHKDGDDWVQVGIVSFTSSIGCDRGFPNGYARVSSFLPWIKDKTGL